MSDKVRWGQGGGQLITEKMWAGGGLHLAIMSLCVTIKLQFRSIKHKMFSIFKTYDIYMEEDLKLASLNHLKV